MWRFNHVKPSNIKVSYGLIVSICYYSNFIMLCLDNLSNTQMIHERLEFDNEGLGNVSGEICGNLRCWDIKTPAAKD